MDNPSQVDVCPGNNTKNFIPEIICSMKSKRFKYDVALSFAEEDRDFVRRVAAYLTEKNVNIFYDDDDRVRTWGKDLHPYLDEIYRAEARYCVMFISKYYKQKRWTQHEKERALARSFFMQNREYILPFRFDDTEIEGVSNNIAYLSANSYDEEELANAIFDKIEKSKKTIFRVPEPVKRFFSKKIGLVTTALFVGSAGIYSISDNLTPVDVLTDRIHEKSSLGKYKAVCNDGTLSRSRGRGTCSHHGGVDYYIDTVAYEKTIEQSRAEAQQISWFAK